jgi:UDPglucose 6-dehydrogenase
MQSVLKREYAPRVGRGLGPDGLATDPMTVTVVGAGYVGAVTGAGFANLGHRVTLVDLDPAVVDAFAAGTCPVREPGLDALVAHGVERHRLAATVDLAAALEGSDLSFVCVGTPSQPDGACYTGLVRAAARSLGEALRGRDRPHLVVVKSTVPPGTADDLVRPTVMKYAGPDAPVAVASNPEFLREGSAVTDFYEPDRVVIGTARPEDAAFLDRLYAPWVCGTIRTTCAAAEMIKYASNAMLAARLSAANEIARICAAADIDATTVLGAVGRDARIGPQFLRVGLGFGGSCLPKDVRALAAFARSLRVGPRVLDATLATNCAMVNDLVELVEVLAAPLARTRVGVLGLAFKPDTDDVRESRALAVIDGLVRRGAEVVAYDPMAMERARAARPDLACAASAQELLDAVGVVVIATEWPAFEDLDYSGHLVVDGRGCAAAKRTAATYRGLVW